MYKLEAIGTYDPNSGCGAHINIRPPIEDESQLRAIAEAATTLARPAYRGVQGYATSTYMCSTVTLDGLHIDCEIEPQDGKHALAVARAGVGYVLNAMRGQSLQARVETVKPEWHS